LPSALDRWHHRLCPPQRTINPRFALKSLSFFLKMKTQNYCSVLAIRCGPVRVGQGRKIIYIRRVRLLVHRQDAPAPPFAAEHVRADYPCRARRPQAFRKLRMHRYP
jgi:hypothetical protein